MGNIGDIIIVMSNGSKTHVGKTAILTRLSMGFGAFCAKIMLVIIYTINILHIILLYVFQEIY